MTGPTGLAARRVTPDLARGLMLALIAMANAHLYLVERPIGYRGYPAGLTGGDAVLAAVQMVLVDGRVYPLFAALVGYGVARLAERAPDAADSVLKRRGLVLLGIGALHGFLLFPGDIVGAYGLVVLLLAPSLAGPRPVSSRALAVLAAVFAGLSVLLGAAQGMPQGAPTVPSVAAPTLGAFLGGHPAEWLVTAVFSALLTAPAVLVGVVIARTRTLDEPAAHRGRLAWWAQGGLLGSVVLGLPLALAVAGVWAPSGIVGAVAGAAHTAGGYAGALGLLGVMGLLGSVRWPGRDLIAASGTWSMTLYLSQSVVFVAVFATVAGGLGATASLTSATLVGLATWLVGLLVAGPLARAGHRGPAELVVRRLTYPRRTVTTTGPDE
ncbi:hypothetical protein Acsp06_55820 [Actinomycetospora sp. NBRC 106375]|uniref:DUF418 domain-containing protein n=1 Tax=Actinomycetospora sp. NBRC 106375 TaxID=3032207 RepID=UPI0024A4DC20|nr:DUF418 domain-containing protein [Actinomycetospora sp. NBRC 106375]GLZ49397.1 hypothetical protein Acsp06_55820 [Actinomycetospora sp. NBRC 106375]